MNKKTLSIITTTAILCAMLSACSGAASASSSSAAAAESSAASSAGAEQAHDNLIGGVLERNSIEVGTLNAWIDAKDKEGSAQSGYVSPRNSFENKQFASLNAMLLELKAGRVDFLRLPNSVANYIAATDDTLKYVVGVREQHYHMAARTEDAALCDELSNAFQELKADGTIDKLVEEYITNANGNPTNSTLKHIDGAETHIVAVTGDLPPLDYISADCTPAGFNVALLNAISEKTGCNFELVQMDAAARLTALQSGKVDLIFWLACSGTAENDPQTDGITLTVPYFEELSGFLSTSQATLDIIAETYPGMRK
ncbi:MAG: transporter substrate-binding domain-containing protein [Ruminococcaceae bacterium]|nr:transporter substrate-binding domain-containing protein [Oscillospiraceae bacterium]